MSRKTASRKISPSPQDADKLPGKAGENRRDQIVKAAVRLFSETGYFQTTIDDIAAAADVSKGLIYLYFKDKHDLLFYALRFVLEIYERDISPLYGKYNNPLAMLRMALRTYCRLVNEHKQETVLAYRSTKDLAPAERSHVKLQESKSCRVLRNCLEACIHNGILAPVNIDIMVYQYVMFSHTWALKNWAFRDKYSFEEYLTDGEKILIDNFLTDYGKEISARSAAEGSLARA
ncbi:MAG TPA: TetR/AcrR family transcriptional regulator [Rhodomicrobium sp.]|nr:TetR/AcrR family transcriptional regulator [Rhodomicrobium sp.]